ncbi:MAG: carboxypeptidase-like regulatory domain-containing protein, partial [Planctomycetota bacterium]
MQRKKFLFSILIFMAIVLFGIMPASAQTGKIAGIIVDVDTGEPLAGANVVVEGLAMGSSADADGFFFILNLVPGTYSLTASYVGYQTTTQTDVNVSLNKTTNVDF